MNSYRPLSQIYKLCVIPYRNQVLPTRVCKQCVVTTNLLSLTNGTRCSRSNSTRSIISVSTGISKPKINIVARIYSTAGENKKKQPSAIADYEEKPQSQLSTARKVVEAGKDASYLGVIVIGFAITGVLLWSIFRELFSGSSVNSIYSHTLKMVKKNLEVQDALGTPIKAHGDQSGRNRYRNIGSQPYVVDDVNYLRVKYYINGSKNKGTVHVDLKETSRGKYEYRYVLVELTGYERGTIVVEDNR